MANEKCPPTEAGRAPSTVATLCSEATAEFARSVNWLVVHRFVQPILAQVDGWPPAGTPAWFELAYDDPVKWCAVLDAAQHWALRIDCEQEARAEASKAVSAAADWVAVANELRQIREFQAKNPWAKREAL
jgi:hypothetical protein